MIKVTLDHNCIISLENELIGKSSPKDVENAQYLKPLVALHNPPLIIVSAAAIGASERLPNGGYNHNFADYEKRIALLGLLHLDIPMPLPVGRWGMTYYGQAVDRQQKILKEQFIALCFPTLILTINPTMKDK